MKILLISTPSRHGAGIVSYDLKNQLEKIGHEVYILSRYTDTDNNVKALTTSRFKILFNKLVGKVKKVNNKKDAKYHFFDNREYTAAALESKSLQLIPENIDLVIVSFYQHFLNFHSFDKIKKRHKVPFLFWMMDMAAFTGGCHYSWNCNNYQITCGNCPALYSNSESDISNKNLQYKAQVINELNVSAIAISAYQQEQAKKSSLFANIPVYLMYHAINLKEYKPVDHKAKLKHRYNIFDDKVLFFLASNIQEYRKGFSQFYQALKEIDLTNDYSFTVVLTGFSTVDYSKGFSNINLIQTGNIKQKKQVIELYQLSSFTVVPTLMDSGPLTVMESLACGTPVITYEMGIGADAIKQNYNGFICEPDNIAKLKQNIVNALNLKQDAFNLLSGNARKTAETHFSDTKQCEVLETILTTVNANN